MKKLLVLVSLMMISACGGVGGGGGGATLSSIAVTSDSGSIFVNGTKQFTATGTYSDGSTSDITGTVTWTSSDTAVVTITSIGGIATGVSAGTATITASLEGKSGSATLTVAVAPSGKLAFVSIRDNNTNQVYVMNADGSNQVRLSSHDGFDPLWSPDAGKVLFSSYKDTSLELWVANPDGTGETQLTFQTWAADYNVDAAWSFDGTQIAFISYRTGGTQVYVMNPDGSGQTRISNMVNPYSFLTMTFTYPSWSPDGTTITADTSWIHSGGGTDDEGGIYAFTVGAPGVGIQLTHSANDHNAVWSPDGTKIAFYRQNSGANPTGSDIYVMNSGGGGETKLAEGLNPVWSPDGTKIAFLRDLNDTGVRLYVMDADGTNEVNLMSDFDNLGVTWRPSWSPDSKMLPFEYDGAIYIINADGTGLIKITNDVYSEVGPQWAPQ
jgi:Tol biopolymer transport system component